MSSLFLCVQGLSSVTGSGYGSDARDSEKIKRDDVSFFDIVEVFNVDDLQGKKTCKDFWRGFCQFE